MPDQDQVVRAKLILNDYALPLIVACVLLLAVGGYATYTAHGQTQTTTERFEQSSWESSAQFTHSATVTESTAVFSRGETLQNRDQYFRSVAPVLDGAFRYGYTATDSGSLTVDTSVTLLMQSVDETEARQSAGETEARQSAGETEASEPVQYWRLDSALANSRVADLGPGEEIELPFSINVSTMRDRLITIDQQLGGTPGDKQLVVVAQTDLSGTLNGEQISDSRSYRLPITIDANLYQPTVPGSMTQSDRQMAERTVVENPGLLRAAGGPTAVIVGGVGMLLLTAGRVHSSLRISDAEREWLSYTNDRNEFDEWITVASIIPDDRPSPDILIDSLKGLVDIAIDTDSRVIEDAPADRFYVRNGGVTYAYDPPSLEPDSDASAVSEESASHDPAAPTANGADTDDATRDHTAATATASSSGLDEPLADDLTAHVSTAGANLESAFAHRITTENDSDDRAAVDADEAATDTDTNSNTNTGTNTEEAATATDTDSDEDDADSGGGGRLFDW